MKKISLFSICLILFACQTKTKEKFIEISIDGQNIIKVPDNAGLYKPNEIILVRIRTIDKDPKTNVYFAWGKYSQWTQDPARGILPPSTTEYKGDSRIDTWYSRAIVLSID